VLGIGDLKRQRFDIQCEQGAQRRLVTRPLCALLVTVNQLEQRNGRDADALAIREVLCEPAACAGRPVVEHRDHGVRIQVLCVEEGALVRRDGRIVRWPDVGERFASQEPIDLCEDRGDVRWVAAIGSRIT
jgi:hypothetical protein